MSLAALIFDVDGTLVDTNRMHARAWQQVFEAYGFRVPIDRLLPEIGKGGDRLVPAVVGEAAEEQHGKAMREQQGEAYLKLVEKEGVEVFPGAADVLEAARARGLQTALATASREEDLETMLEAAGLDPARCVDAVVTDSDVEESKPHPDTVEAAVDKLGVAAAQCALVGDTPYDAEAALRAGVVPLGVLTGAHDAQVLHRAGMRASYADTSDLLAHLDEALRLAAPGAAPLTQAHMERLMQKALDEAWTGLAEGEVPIGSVLARGDGTILARGRNRAHATGSALAHAEMQALAEAGPQMQEDAEGLLLVSTLEPCVMCFGAALVARVDTVVYALEAPENGGTRRCTPLGGEGAFMPRRVGGVRAEGSRALLRRWLDKHPDDDFVRRLLEGYASEGGASESA